jgi:hypothetical protein
MLTTEQVKALGVDDTLYIEVWAGDTAGAGARAFAGTVTVTEKTAARIRCQWTPEEGDPGYVDIRLQNDDGSENPDIDRPAPDKGRFVFLAEAPE